MQSLIRLQFYLWTIITVGAAPLHAVAHDGSLHRGEEAIAAPGPQVGVKAREYFTNLPVITQNNERLNFYDDVLSEKIVLVTLFYTQCPDACPLITDKVAAVQALLESQFDELIQFVSVTVDPERDTPDVIREYAGRFRAGDRWLFLTGDKQDLAMIAHRLGQPGEVAAAHPPFLLVGDTRKGYWRKFWPSIADEELAQFLRDLANSPGATSGQLP